MSFTSLAMGFTPSTSVTTDNRDTDREESCYNKCNTHFDVQELLLQFWMEHHETWQDMERRRQRYIAEPKFELKMLRLSSSVFYGRDHISEIGERSCLPI